MGNTSFIIHDWFINKLKLTGHELIVYALIYSFSKDGNSKYYGSITYLKNITGVKSRTTVINTLNSLINKGYIKKILGNSRETNKYYADLEVVQKLDYPSTKIEQGVVQKLDMGSTKIEHNNNIINIIDNKEWVYSSFELKYFDWVNIKPIEKALQKEFVGLWNEEKERVGQKSYLKTLPERHTELYLQIRSIHTSKEIKHALKALFQQKEIFSETQHLDPTHFLNNFNKWFSAYNEGNKQVYVKKQLNKL
jgi:hypothetical protein